MLRCPSKNTCSQRQAHPAAGLMASSQARLLTACLCFVFGLLFCCGCVWVVAFVVDIVVVLEVTVVIVLILSGGGRACGL